MDACSVGMQVCGRVLRRAWTSGLLGRRGPNDPGKTMRGLDEVGHREGGCGGIAEDGSTRVFEVSDLCGYEWSVLRASVIRMPIVVSRL